MDVLLWEKINIPIMRKSLKFLILSVLPTTASGKTSIRIEHFFQKYN